MSAKHHAYVYGFGKSRYQARCRKCGWKAEKRSIFAAAWVDARNHDPDFPRGDRSIP